MEPRLALRVNGKASRSIRLAVSPRADFRQIIHTFDGIEIPPSRISPENFRFAILELVNNSIRAHREKGDDRDILIELTLDSGRLYVTIRDYGGGFDPRRLPYDLETDPAALNLQSEPFQQYQKQNNYKRFGMGIFVAKKTFDHFALVFVNDRDLPIPWAPGRVIGTLITVDIGTQAAAGTAASVMGGK